MPGVHQVTRGVQWFGPGRAAHLHGYDIPGGMIYVGRGLRAPAGIIEPALIDPVLRVDVKRPDVAGASMGYWPAYEEIRPAARGAYLAWLAGGRRQPGAYIGYVFLFLYGLERRVLVDVAADKSLSWELPQIRGEVQRLLDLYGDNSSFRGYAGRFVDVIELLAAANTEPQDATPPPLVARRWPPPVSLQVELGAFAADRTPVPAEWALAWAWYHPDITTRTAATRCPDEFATLFKRRYTAKYDDGLVIRPGKSTLGVSYHPASAGIGTAEMTLSLPDVLAQQGPGRKLADLVNSTTGDLDAYSRWLGRNPESRGSLAGAALLPAELLDETVGEVADLRDWITDSLGSQDSAVVNGADLIARWPTVSNEKMSKPETVAMAQMLSHFGVGVEPDVRLAGPPITATAAAVVFTTGPGSPHAATPAYRAASTLVHLAAAVSAADGQVSDQEQQQLVAHLESSLHLTAGERTRLHAHLRWLAATEIKLTGLRKRLDALSDRQRAAIGDLLVTVAAADGVISPEEVTSLFKIYKLLGLDPDTVTSRLHASMTGVGRPLPATGPVTVRPAGPPDTGYTIPTPPTAPIAGPAGGVRLDAAAVEAKLAETAAVSALLGTIFTEDDALPAGRRIAVVGGSAPGAPSVGAMPTGSGRPGHESTAEPVEGLDAAHSALLRTLAERDSWSRGEYENLAAVHDVMPDGALDVLNEVAIEASGEPVVEGDDTHVINLYALQELLG